MARKAQDKAGTSTVSVDGDRLEEDGWLIRESLREMLRDKDTPAAARAQAARTLAEMTGLLGRHQEAPREEDTRPLSSLTPAELRRELARLDGL